jgi:ATP-dependent Clp protease ATP-binding subunit ClpX
MWHRKATSSSFRYSFCHKPKDQVEQLLAGPQGVYICNTCVDCCQQVMQKERREAASSPSLLNVA